MKFISSYICTITSNIFTYLRYINHTCAAQIITKAQRLKDVSKQLTLQKYKCWKALLKLLPRTSNSGMTLVKIELTQKKTQFYIG